MTRSSRSARRFSLASYAHSSSPCESPSITSRRATMPCEAVPGFIETLSVIIQVVSFKLTGKRVFRMAPVHHHFEQLGWPEQKIVVRFWIVSIILGLVALSSLKLR